MHLLQVQHGEDDDDFIGRALNHDGTEWDRAPATAEDAQWIRFIMKMCGRSQAEIDGLRLHKSKPTLTSLAQHGLQTLAVNMQGSWKGNSESVVATNYLRDAMLMALQLEEKLVAKWRSGGYRDVIIKAGRVAETLAPSTAGGASQAFQIPPSVDLESENGTGSTPLMIGKGSPC